MEEIMKSIGLNKIKYSNIVPISAIPPWMFVMPIIDVKLVEEIKKQYNDPIKVQVHQYIYIYIVFVVQHEIAIKRRTDFFIRTCSRAGS